jgi:cellobiose phosphorylase
MRRTKRASQKRNQLAKEAQERATRIERLYQNAATTGLKATSGSLGDFNDGFRQIADEMNAFSVRSLEQVFHAWQQFLHAGPLRQAVEFQTRYAQNAQNAYEDYADELSRLGDLYLNATRRFSKPLAQVPRRAK